MKGRGKKHTIGARIHLDMDRVLEELSFKEGKTKVQISKEMADQWKKSKIRRIKI